MRLTYILSLILFIMQLNSSLAQVNVPKGVIYHKTSDANNNEAKKLITKAVETKESKLIFESTVMIGPNLWQKYLNSKYAQADMGIELNFKIPIGKEIVTRKGRIIKKGDEFKSLWEFISTELSGGSLRIPKEAELGYYWSIIAYEIEEPIFVMENKKNKILFNLTPNENKLVFLESL